jgi:hypothetical protein
VGGGHPRAGAHAAREPVDLLAQHREPELVGLRGVAAQAVDAVGRDELELVRLRLVVCRRARLRADRQLDGALALPALALVVLQRRRDGRL